jgi:hypothetical protein
MPDNATLRQKLKAEYKIFSSTQSKNHRYFELITQGMFPSTKMRFCFFGYGDDSGSRAISENTVFERQIRDDHFERIMNVMCNGLEAETLLDLANHVYPDIAPGTSLATSLGHKSQFVRSDK